jgi:hypothetical protein
MSEITLDMSKTYIHDGLEYILTGRTATKHVDGISPKKRSARAATFAALSKMMVEIKPHPKVNHFPSLPNPTVGTETKWVDINELFIVDDVLGDQ